ncbi:MAG: phosphatase PAP2 family protein [Pseudomonadota bacterium]
MAAQNALPQRKTHTPLYHLGNPFFAAGLFAAWFVSLGIWATNGTWDLAIARWFFDAELCGQTAREAGFCFGFPAATDPFLRFVRSTLQHAPKWIGVGLLSWVIADWIVGFRLKDPSFRARTALLATLIIWPLIIVNGILKAYWGRPRPWQTEDFGGPFPFVEAGTITDYCASNCSFVSGEASSAGWLALLFLLFPPRLRIPAAVVLSAIGLFMAGLRMAFGAHYASDVFLGFFGAIVTFAVVAAILERYHAKA